MNRGRAIFWQFTLSFGIGAGAVGFAAARSLPCGYSVDLAQQRCGFPFPDAVTQALGISPDGSIVVGRWMDCFFLADHAFIWRAGGGLETIPYPPTISDMEMVDANDRGQIVGNHDGIGFFYESGKVISMGTLPGGTGSEAFAVNSSGTAVGWWGNSLTGIPTVSEGFIWREGIMTSLGPLLPAPKSKAFDINDLEQITGYLGTSVLTDVRAFILHGDKLTVLPPVPGGYTSEGRAINSSGQVAGIGLKINPETRLVVVRGFMWTGTRMIDLGIAPGYEDTWITDIDDEGRVLGYCTPSAGSPELDGFLFVWQDGVMLNLDQAAIAGEPFDLGVPFAISNAGIIAGVADASGGPHAARLTPLATKSADLDQDSWVGSSDLVLLLSGWGRCPRLGCSSDLDCNGVVNGYDLAHLLAAWSLP